MIILSLCTFIYRRRYLLAATAPPSITISCFIDGSIVLENVAPLRNIQRKTINTGVIYIGSTKKRFALCLRNKSATHVTSQLPDGSTTEAPLVDLHYERNSLVYRLLIFWWFVNLKKNMYFHLKIQGVFEMRAQILTTSYWLHVELRKHI
jgi:hypothetical protein